MKISNKLLFIVVLTIIEVSITLWSVVELSKGAKFHQLNSLHLKYSAVFTQQVLNYEDSQSPNEDNLLDDIRSTLSEIRKPPVECLDMVNSLNIMIMKAIDTYKAYELCIKDIKDIDDAVATLNDYQADLISRQLFIERLKNSALVFNQNSAYFEQPITKTVRFLVNAFIPMVIAISLFNILFISLMSRSISSSIAKAISILKFKSNETIDNVATGELKELLEQAFKRAKELNIQAQVNAELEQKVTQRTASLMQANSELSQFAYRTSHDLKSPIIATRQLAEIIKFDIENNNTQNAINDLDRVEEEMSRLEKLIKNILALTEASQSELAQQVVDIKLLTSQITQTMTQRALKQNVEIRLDIENNLLIKAPEARLTQIISNLVSNAIKYCDKNKAERFVCISVEYNENLLHINVNDNGLGFPDDRRNEVFEMFKRFHHDVNSGTGLGLAIVKKHIDAMHGTIQLNSSTQGSEILVCLPCEISNT